MPLRRILVDGHAQCEANLRQALGDAEFEAAFLRGAELTYDQALSYALEFTPPDAGESRDIPSGR